MGNKRENPGSQPEQQEWTPAEMILPEEVEKLCDGEIVYYVLGDHKNLKEKNKVARLRGMQSDELFGYVNTVAFKTRMRSPRWYNDFINAAKEVKESVQLLDEDSRKWYEFLNKGGLIDNLAGMGRFNPGKWLKFVGAGGFDKVFGSYGVLNFLLAWQRARNIEPNYKRMENGSIALRVSEEKKNENFKLAGKIVRVTHEELVDTVGRVLIKDLSPQEVVNIGSELVGLKGSLEELDGLIAAKELDGEIADDSNTDINTLYLKLSELEGKINLLKTRVKAIAVEDLGENDQPTQAALEVLGAGIEDLKTRLDMLVVALAEKPVVEPVPADDSTDGGPVKGPDVAVPAGEVAEPVPEQVAERVSAELQVINGQIEVLRSTVAEIKGQIEGVDSIVADAGAKLAERLFGLELEINILMERLRVIKEKVLDENSMAFIAQAEGLLSQLNTDYEQTKAKVESLSTTAGGGDPATGSAEGEPIVPVEEPAPNPEPSGAPAPEPAAEPSGVPAPEPAAEPSGVPVPEPAAEPKPEEAIPVPEPKPEDPKVEKPVEPAAEPARAPAPESAPEPAPEPEPKPAEPARAPVVVRRPDPVSVPASGPARRPGSVPERAPETAKASEKPVGLIYEIPPQLPIPEDQKGDYGFTDWFPRGDGFFYPVITLPALGKIRISGGFMEPSGHGFKEAIYKAILPGGTEWKVPPGEHNIGIDYVTMDNKGVKAWYGGEVVAAIAMGTSESGGYGNRVIIKTKVKFKYKGKEYDVYQAYGHLDSINKKATVGASINQGVDIGIMGGTGKKQHSYPDHVDLRTFILADGATLIDRQYKWLELSPNLIENQLMAAASAEGVARGEGGTAGEREPGAVGRGPAGTVPGAVSEPEPEADPAVSPGADPVPNPVSGPESALEHSPEYLNSILAVYRDAMGPGKNSKGFYYIDITDNFKPFGPFPDVPGDRDTFHDGNRRGIANDPRNVGVFVDYEKDQPVVLLYGEPEFKFEPKLARMQAPYLNGTLLTKTIEFFDGKFNGSVLKTTLQTGGADGYFRDLIIYGLVAQESGWRIEAVSSAPAYGLFQILPSTRGTMIEKHKIPDIMGPFDPFDPQQAAEIAVILFQDHLEYFTDKMGADSFMLRGGNVKTLLIPLLLTSFDQGQGRMVNLANYLKELHEAGTIPAEFYTDRTVPTFNDNAFLYLCSRAYIFLQTKKEIVETPADSKLKAENGWIDEETQEFKSRYSKDGAQYVLKIMANAQNFMKALGVSGSP